MTTPFVASLRARPDTIRLCANGVPCITVRVEMPEVWDTVRLQVAPTEPVRSVKVRAFDALFREGSLDDVVMKLNGFEVLDESASLTQAGAVDGSTFLMTFRRRRPVKS